MLLNPGKSVTYQLRFSLCTALILFTCSSIRLFGYRAYTYDFYIHGGKTGALGTFTAPGLWSSDALYGNPALLGRHGFSHIIWEFEAGARFAGLRFDYRVLFDVLSGLGYYQSYNNQASEYKTGFGIAYYSLFKDTNERNMTSGINIRKVGVSRAFRLAGTHNYFGINIGPAIAIENKQAAVFPSLQTGFTAQLHPAFNFSLYGISPNYFKWRNTGITETTPFLAAAGVKWQPHPAFGILGEIAWQGWDWVSYSENGNAHHVHRGNSRTDFFQDIFPGIGFFYNGAAKLVRADGISGQAAAEKLREVNSKIRELSVHPDDPGIVQKLKTIYEERAEKSRALSKIRTRSLTHAEEEQIKELQREVFSLQREYKKIKETHDAEDVLFGGREKKNKFQTEMAEIQKKIEDRYDTIKKIKAREMNEEEQLQAAELEKRLREINGEITEQKNIRKKMHQDFVAELNLSMKKNRKKDDLTDFQQLLLSREIERKNLLKEKISLRRVSRSVYGKASILNGEFYLNFRPAVHYTSDGSYGARGILGAGFSFRPTNIDSLFITVSAQDQTILKLLDLFPDNAVEEIFRISTDFRF